MSDARPPEEEPTPAGLWDPDFWDSDDGPAAEAPDAADSGETPPADSGLTGSWGKVVGITVAACVVAGALLWLALPKQPTVTEAAAPPPATDTAQQDASAAEQEVRRILAGKKEHQSKAERLEERLGKPPKLSVQVFDPLEGTCPDVFNVTMVVRVIRGQYDGVVAEVRIPKDKYTRTRTLMYSEGDYTATLGGLPVNRTATLRVVGSGVNGETTTVSKDITHACPGDLVDQDNHHDLLGKDAEQAIREKMFGGDYEFHFDSKAGGQ